jgi:hypothetical protein
MVIPMNMMSSTGLLVFLVSMLGYNAVPEQAAPLILI